MTTNRRQLLGVAAGVAAGGLAATKAGAQQPSAPPAWTPPAQGPYSQTNRGVPLPGSVAPLRPRIDYDALRQRRAEQADAETKAINFDRPGPPAAGRPTPALPPGITISMVEVETSGGKMPMRLYMPERVNNRPLGLYLHTHSGGFAAGEGFAPISDVINCSYVRDWGCAVAQPDFRTSWDAKFPAAIDDCYAAYNYILAHASQWGVDRTRIGIGGGCTGGNLATVVSMMARDAGLQKPAVQWLWSTTFDQRNKSQSYLEFGAYSLPSAIADTVAAAYLSNIEDLFDWRASPLLAETMKGAPPAIIWVGGWEVLRDESRQYANRLRDAGVEVTFIEGENQPHGGIYAINPATGQPTRYSRETVPHVNELMRRYLGPRPR